jgi:hypothetical protein
MGVNLKRNKIIRKSKKIKIEQNNKEKQVLSKIYFYHLSIIRERLF